MEALRSLFPASDFTLLAVVLALPALGALVNGLFGKRLGKDGVRLLGKGELTTKLSFKIAGASKGAREAVEKAGGSIELIERKDPAELAAAKKGSAKAKRTEKAEA